MCSFLMGTLCEQLCEQIVPHLKNMLFEHIIICHDQKIQRIWSNLCAYVALKTRYLRSLEWHCIKNRHPLVKDIATWTQEFKRNHAK